MLLALGLLTAQLQAPKLSLPQDQVLICTLQQEYTDPEEDLSLVLVSELRYKVLQTGSQTLFQVSDKQVKMVMDGQDIPISEPNMPSVYKQERSELGGLIRHEENSVDPRLSRRIARLLCVPLPKPSQLGERTWTLEYPTSVDGQMVAARYTARLEGAAKTPDGKPAMLLKVWFKETEGSNPLTAEGSALVDTASGWPVQLQLACKNVPIPGGESKPTDMKLIFELKPSVAKNQ